MITNTTAADRADSALQAFVATTDETYNSTYDQLADLLASSHHLARRLGLDWKALLNDAGTLYKATKPAPAAKPAKAAKASSAKRGELYRLVATAPNGQQIEVERGRPYSHAVLLDTGSTWELYALVSSKDTAKKRAGDARRAGRTEQHAIAEVQIASSPAPSFETDRAIMLERATADAEVEQPTDQQPADAEQNQPTDEPTREAEVEEPFHVQIVGGTAIHYSDDGEDTYCGCGPATIGRPTPL